MWQAGRQLAGSDQGRKAAIEEALAALRKLNIVRDVLVERRDGVVDGVMTDLALASLDGHASPLSQDPRDALIRRLAAQVETLSQTIDGLEKVAAGKALAIEAIHTVEEELVALDREDSSTRHKLAMGIVREEADTARRQVEDYRLKEQAGALDGGALGQLRALIDGMGVSRKDKPTPRVVEFLEGHFLASQNLDDTHKRHIEAYVRLFARITGDKPLAAYTRQDIVEWVKVIERFPANYGKGRRDKNRPVEEILKEARREGIRTISETTVGKHIINLKKLFREANGIHEFTNTDRIEMMFGNIHLSRFVPKARERRPWSIDQLGGLFATPIWTGTKSRREDRSRRHEPGPLVHVDAYWWLPIAALHTGARLEELCQLHHDDLREVNGIPFIHIHDEGSRRVKTRSSIRAVPIHPLLQELGFLRLFRPGQGGRVFTELSKNKVLKTWGADYSQDFTAYRKECGVYEELRDFHSLRHTCISFLRGKAKVDKSLVAAMVGHGQGEDPELAEFAMTDHYTDFDVADRLEAISKLDYEKLGLDLGHIRRAAALVKDGRGTVAAAKLQVPLVIQPSR